MKLTEFKNQSDREETREGINKGEEKAREKLGINVSYSEVTQLQAGVAGIYNLHTKEKKFDIDFFRQQTSENITHVILHESYHQSNKEKGDDELIGDIGVEEALTELATSKISGKTIAYQQEITQLRTSAYRESVSVEYLIDLYREGQNARINNLLNLTPDA